MSGKRWWIIAGIVVVFLLGAKFLLFDTAASPSAPYSIDIEALHKAAVAQGPLPTGIEVERVGDFAFPRSFVVAGDGLTTMHPMILLAHRVVYPDRTVIIDTAMSPSDASILPGARLHEPAYERLEKALTKAKAIVFTHEHVDHVGGMARAPNFDAVAPQTVITKEQFEGPRLEREKFAPGRLEKLKPIEYGGLYTVAPGIVLQKAPGHSTGTQLIYVELENGQKYLFVGDIAWSEDNIKLQRGRPPLFTWMAKEDREAVASQLVALAELPKDVHLVIAHDPVAYARDLKAGLYTEGFKD